MLSITLLPRRPRIELDDPRLLKAEEIRGSALPRIGECYTGKCADGFTRRTSPVVDILDLPWTVDPRLWPTETLDGCLPSSWRFVETRSGEFFAVLIYNITDTRN